MADPQRTTDIYGLLIDQNRVLMLPDETGSWTLPHVHLPDKYLWLALVDVAVRGLQKVLSADVTVLRYIYFQYLTDPHRAELVYDLENHSPDWTPPKQARWVNADDLKSLTLTHPEHRIIIEERLKGDEDTSGLRPVWARRGWFKSASTWMQEQLVAQGYVLTSPPEQLKTWGISCLLKAATNQGDIFFKVSSTLPLFGNEPAVLKALSDRYPEFVPKPIAIEPEQRWMLMRDFGAELRTAPTPEKWEIVARQLAVLQTQTAPIIDELLAAGCLDRRLPVLRQQIADFVNDESMMAVLSADEVSQIQALAPRLQTMCGELAAYRVPYTLNHGDLHAGNITLDEMLFFDWTDACIAHPFLDLITGVMDVDNKLPNGPEPVLMAYLDLWTVYEPIERLREMWLLAAPLGAFHQVVSYQHILNALEPSSKKEMIGGVAEWVRRVIQNVPH